MNRNICIGLLALTLCLTAKQAPADQATCPPLPDTVPRGLVLKTSLGPAFWVGDMGQVSRPGIAFGFSAGYELFSWLAVEAIWTTGIHATDQPPPPQQATFTTQVLQGALRLGIPLGRFDLFARGGVGMLWSRPDVLRDVDGFDGQERLAYSGGAGVTWHSPRRYVWLGFDLSAMGAKDFPGIWLLATMSLGITL
jgi:hypothetical protein